ncbi:MAG: Uma2 family endonuclease [Planctomycetaceae bacterium]
MATATEPESPPRTATGQMEARQLLTLDGVTWDQYVAISDALPDRPGLRITFDGERLELMATSQRHERMKKLIGRMIEMITLELDIDLQSGGNVTFRREDLEKGLEPDECYWIAHARDMIGVDEWDPAAHPPPDLAVEMDVKSRSILRQPIYAALGVLELWRFDGAHLRALRLEAGQYVPIDHSLSLPFLRVAELAPFLHRTDEETETDTIRAFVQWLRAQDFPRA